MKKIKRLNEKARELAAQNVGLVYYVVKGVVVPHHLSDDAIGIGMVALSKAARSFDPEKGYQFSTYASNVIFYEVVRWVQKTQKKDRKMLDIRCVSDNQVVYRDDSFEESDDRKNLLCKLLDSLSLKEQLIIQKRFFSCRKVSFDEIGQEFGLCKERIRQIEKISLKKMRKKAEELGAVCV